MEVELKRTEANEAFKVKFFNRMKAEHRGPADFTALVHERDNMAV